MRVNDGTDPAIEGWRWSRQDLQTWAHAVADLVVDILVSGSDEPLAPHPPEQLLEAWRTEPWAEHGTNAADLFEEVRRQIAPYPFGNAHPRFSAWVNSPPHPLGALAAGIAAAMNPSVAGGDHAAVHLEHQVVRWFCELLDWSAPAGGQLVSGASAASLTALAVARHQALRRIDVDDRRQGVSALRRKPVIYATAEAHSCHIKAAEALGFGSANIVEIPADSDHRMRPAALEHVLGDHADSEVLPVAVIASAGTVNTGALDPVGEIADICARHGVWLHVDAAYGGAAVLLLDEWAHVCAALARADSIAIDPHKWLYVPVDAGIVLFRNTSLARDAFSLVPNYLDRGDTDEPVWFSEFGLEQTRPFRALKVWMTLKHLGRQRMSALITRDIAVAAALRDTIASATDFELLAHGLSVVCFRHHRAGMPADALDRHNQAVLYQLQQRGNAFIAGTRIGQQFALRACIVNPTTTTTHTDALLEELRAAAAEVGE